VVIGVSPDDCLCHAEFRDANGVSITLLSDCDNEVCAQYGVLRTASAAGGKERNGVTRATFIIDKHGTVRHALYDVVPRGHAAQVLTLVKKLPR
jgi:peroxiredoxin Q/BCP